MRGTVAKRLRREQMMTFLNTYMEPGLKRFRDRMGRTRERWIPSWPKYEYRALKKQYMKGVEKNGRSK